MEKTEFARRIQDALELPDEIIDLDAALEIDSMGVLALIAFFDENFNLKVKAIELKGKNTINKLIELLGQIELS